ncbi:6-bladed beta-propeller [uncultured Parabacteroides sp.]|uniref:6-bladed beta-propeller n=1 Tax=uncultured Parabacteroides sp. TaxID=512312 RepID=UPI0025869CCB|nr:6-bladed beta-propeller [uncultured Parabacteroides sp.]
MKKRWIYLLSSLLLLSCLETKKEKEEAVSGESVGIPVFDISSNISNSVPDTFTWNSIAKYVQFIPLNSEVLLNTSLDPIYTGTNLNVIVDNKADRINVFDSSGKCKSSFKHVGQGPGEYIYLTFVRFNEADSTLFVFDNGNSKIITYSLEGKCLEERLLNSRDWGNIHFVDKEGVMYTRGTNDGYALISALNENLEVDKKLFLFDSIATPRKRTATTLTCARSETRDAYILNRAWEDTVFVIENKMAVPFCVLNKSSHALPEKEVENFLKLPPENDYFIYTGINLFSSYLHYRYLFQGNFYSEIWDIESQTKIVSRSRKLNDSNEEDGCKYVFDSGKTLRLIPYAYEKKRLIFFIPAEKCMSEFKGMKEDDNPVLMIMDLK